MNPKPIHPGNLETFLEVYAEKLKANVAANPADYSWGLDQFYTVLSRMRLSIARGTFNKDSESFKQTCKALGIKHTYKAINEFISL